MGRWNLRTALAGMLLVAGSVVRAEECQCSPGKVTYIVVEMPEQSQAAALTTGNVESAPSPVFSTVTPSQEEEAKPTYSAPTHNKPVHDKPPTINNARPENTTHSFTPCSAPNIDRTDVKHLVPAKNVSLYYSSTDENEQGSINMTLAFDNPAVVLEHADAVSEVVCGDDTLTVKFANLEGFTEAVQDWDINEPFILITGSEGNCAQEFERGFFVVSEVDSDSTALTVTVTASKQELAAIAGKLEMDFTSLPAATLTRRLTLDPSYALTFADGLAGPTTLFTDGQYITVTAEEAWFSSTLTFSGKLVYNFWGFKLEELYFDIDAQFDSSAAVSASITAAFTQSISYEPEDLVYSLVSVPGVISLGPGIGFGLTVDVDATAAVGLYTGIDISMPAGNVHVDFLDGSQTTTSGWEPAYDSYANITEAADVSLDVGADVTVMLQFKLLGGLVDLSSGVTASPGFANTFKLRGEQVATVNGTTQAISAGIEVPVDALACADTNGIEFTSEFLFKVSAFATQWFSRDLYSVTVPLVDYCLAF